MGRTAFLSALVAACQQRTPLLIQGDPRRGKSSLLAYLGTELESMGWKVSVVSGLHLQSMAVQLATEQLQAPLQAHGDRALLIDDLDLLWKSALISGGAAGDCMASLIASGVWVVACCRFGLIGDAQRKARGLGSLKPVTLPLFSDQEVGDVLGMAGTALSPQERAFVQHVCGNEPYMTQMLAGAILDLPTRNPRCTRAGYVALATVDHVIAPVWRSASSSVRWALLAMVLAQHDTHPTPMIAPEISSPTLRALLALLCLLSRFELDLLARSTLKQRFDPQTTRTNIAAALIRMLPQHDAVPAALGVLLNWRPDIAPRILQVADVWQIPIAGANDINNLIERGIIAEQDGHLQIRCHVRTWWIQEQLSVVARQDVPLPQWLKSQGLLPPSPSAVPHLKWRIGRLAGLLSRGSGAFIENTMMKIMEAAPQNP